MVLRSGVGALCRCLAAFCAVLLCFALPLALPERTLAAGGYVNVGLSKYSGVSSVTIGSYALNVYVEPESDPVYTFESSQGFSVAPVQGGFALIRGGETLCVLEAPLFRGTDGLTALGGTSYRGYIKPVGGTGGMFIVNYVRAEEYLYGVVPAEMPASWSIEALKAQAVAARSYMHTQAGVHASRGYDVCDGIHCQVYLGASGESPRSTEAVDMTAGVMAYYGGEPINAVFASSSGGRTENSENVWLEALPYLRGVKEIAENETLIWSRTYTLEQISAGLMANGAGIGSVNSVKAEYLPSGRVVRLTFNGTNGVKVYEKDGVRSFSSAIDGSLPSTLFKINGYSWSEGGVWDGGTAAQTAAPAASSELAELHLSGAYGGTIVKGAPEVFVAGAGGAVNHVSSGALSILAGGGKLSSYTGNIGYLGDIGGGQITSSETRFFTITSGIVTLEGRGNGHGVGMSQYGAKGMAESGYDYVSILKHYFNGIEVR